MAPVGPKINETDLCNGFTKSYLQKFVILCFCDFIRDSNKIWAFLAYFWHFSFFFLNFTKQTFFQIYGTYGAKNW